MPLLPDSLPKHPDGQRVNPVDPECIGYRKQSKWRERYCGNCGWFKERENAASLPNITGDEHPSADGKGTIHGCSLVGGGIAFGGYCIAWGTDTLLPPGAEEEPMSEQEEQRMRLTKIFKRLRHLHSDPGT